MKSDFDFLLEAILNAYLKHGKNSLFTVAISGIDASGKGFVTKQMQEQLEAKTLRVANINIDPWQTPLRERLRKEDSAVNLYDNIFRWNDFFNDLIIPLQEKRAINLDAILIRTDADIYYQHTYQYENLDILLLEGILLFKKQFIHQYDLKIWIDCSFETGLKRAVQRNAENQEESKLVQDYNDFYYAAQRLHLRRDDPRSIADLVYINDPLLLSKGY